MPSDGAHAKFLYIILKQLDLKSIDWAAVASQLEITNGHAARMRFSRFKQHMEGVAPSPRRRNGNSVAASGSSTPRSRKTIVKGEKSGGIGAGPSKKRAALDKIKSNGSPSPEPAAAAGEAPMPLRVKPEPMEEDIDMSVPQMDTEVGFADDEEEKKPLIAVAEQQACDDLPIDPSLTAHTPSTAPERVVTPNAHTSAGGPTRKDFGPFAGVYPPPGVEAVSTMLPIVKQDESEEQPSVLVKSEPTWEES